MYDGRCLRGVKWVFPSPDDHDPEDYFHAGKRVTWYEFKSSVSQTRNREPGVSMRIARRDETRRTAFLFAPLRLPVSLEIPPPHT